MPIKRFSSYIIESDGNVIETLVLEYLQTLIAGTEFEGKVYLAGGAVRDELLGHGIKDIDFVVDLPDGGIKFATWVCKKLGIYKPQANPTVFPKFGTAKFNLRKIKYKGYDLSGVDVECVMPRREKYVSGSRKPEVTDGNLLDDVERRDFTVNSLLKNLSNGEILDLTGQGRTDIQRGVVQTPLDPNVIFSDDPLRMLRAIRFATKYSWKLPLFMIRSIKENAPKLSLISAERIQSEINKMLLTNKPDVAIRLLQITNLSKYIFPELDKLKGQKQNNYHLWDTAKHTNYVLKNTPLKLITRLSALFHDIGKAETKEIIDGEIHFYTHEDVGADITRDILTRLKYPNEIIDAVCAAVKNHMRLKTAGDEGEIISDKALRKLQLELGDHLEHTLDVMHADNIAHKPEYNMPRQIPGIRSRIEQINLAANVKKVILPINGHDIMKEFGLTQKDGPLIGKMLAAVKDAWLENPAISRDEAVDAARNIYNTDYKNDW